MAAPNPKCVIVTGRPGSGKTTLAAKLRELLRMPLLSRDQLKEGLVSSFGIAHEQLPEDTNAKVTELFFSTTETLLREGVSVVVEAAFQHPVWEPAVFRWSRVSRPFILVCEADPELCARRHLDRGLQDPTREFYHGDNRVKVFKETGKFLGPGDYVPPSFEVPTLSVFTNEDYSPGLSQIVEFVTGGPNHSQPGRLA